MVHSNSKQLIPKICKYYFGYTIFQILLHCCQIPFTNLPKCKKKFRLSKLLLLFHINVRFMYCGGFIVILRSFSVEAEVSHYGELVKMAKSMLPFIWDVSISKPIKLGEDVINNNNNDIVFDYYSIIIICPFILLFHQ